MSQQPEAISVTKRTERVPVREINQARNDFINANLCLSPEEAGAIFGKSSKWALEKVMEGKFVAVDDKHKIKRGADGTETIQLSNGVRITASSVARYRRESEIRIGGDVDAGDN